MNLKKQILSALGLEDQVQLGWQGKSEDGTIFVSTAEELEAGVDISVLTEDGTTIPLPAGTYKTDTGVSFRVEDEGVISEVLQSESEEEDTTEEVEASEELAEEDESPAEKADWAKSYEQLKDKVENLEDAIADIKAKIGEGESSNEEEMTEESKEPSTNPRSKTTKTTEVVEFSVDELKAENEKLKAELAKQPAEAPVSTNKFRSVTKTLTQAQLSKLSRRERFLYDVSIKN